MVDNSNIMSIRKVLVLVYIVAITILVISVVVLANRQVTNYLKEYSISYTYSLAERLANDSRFALIQMAEENVMNSVQMALDLPNIKNVVIFDTKGYTLVGQVETGISFADIGAEPIGFGKAYTIKETDRSIYIVSPVHIETTIIYDLALPVAETDVETATGSTHILGYVLVNYDKTHWRSVANRVWIESVSITAIISLILLLVLLHVLGRITKPLKILALLMLDPETAKHYRMASISGVKEVRDISTAYNDLMQALKSSNQELVSSYEHLEERVNERTEELLVARDEAAALNVENRLLIRTMNATVEEERRYIARELHDHIDALLLYVKMGLSLIGNAWSQTHKGGVEEETWIKIDNTISETQKTISTIYDSSRSIVQMLRPEVMDSIGLVGAIEQRVALIRDTHPGCKYLFSHNGDFADLEYTSQMALFRIAQESLTNAAKYSRATEVVIELRRGYKADPNGVVLMIADNGDGFDTSKTTGRGTGLIGMRERAYSIGGKLGVHSTPGEGTIVTAKIPFDSHVLR